MIRPAAAQQLAAALLKPFEVTGAVTPSTISDVAAIIIQSVEVDELQQQLAAQSDAERYRFIRNRPASNIRISSVHGLEEKLECVCGTPMLDAAIDAAMTHANDK